MQRWQAVWPAGIAVLTVVLGACGGGSTGGGVDGAGPDAARDVVAPAPDAGDAAVPALDGGPSPFDLAPAVDVPRDLAPADLSGSGCLVLAQTTTPGEAPPPTGMPGVPAPPRPRTTGDPAKLPPKEIVARLSRFIWRVEPDAALLARVAGCMQLTINDVLLLADLMLNDPRAARGMQAFVTWWLELDLLSVQQRNPASFPPFTDDLRRSMAEEVRLFAAHVLFNDTGTLPRLLTAPYSFVDRQLAAIYDLPPVDDSFRRVDFSPADERAGLLTMPGVLAVSGGSERHSGPVRANRLLNRVLCFDVPPPPANIQPEIPPPSERPGVSLRQAMEKSFSQPACAACHQLLEVGFAFEPFDAIGRHRTTDNGAPIDAHASVRTQQDQTFVSGPVSLAQALAGLASTHRCFARRWLEFGTNPAAGSDEAVVDALTDAFTRAQLDIRALIAQVTITVPFLNGGPGLGP